MKTFTHSIAFLAMLALLAVMSSFTNAASIIKREFSGEATYYAPDGGYGSCGDPLADSDLIVALSYTQMGPDLCGRTIRVSRPGYADIHPVIADTCVSCRYGEIDLSVGAFDRIANRGEARIQVTWDFD